MGFFWPQNDEIFMVVIHLCLIFTAFSRILIVGVYTVLEQKKKKNTYKQQKYVRLI